jgi:hypothetical protein
MPFARRPCVLGYDPRLIDHIAGAELGIESRRHAPPTRGVIDRIGEFGAEIARGGRVTAAVP